MFLSQSLHIEQKKNIKNTFHADIPRHIIKYIPSGEEIATLYPYENHRGAFVFKYLRFKDFFISVYICLLIILLSIHTIHSRNTCNLSMHHVSLITHLISIVVECKRPIIINIDGTYFHWQCSDTLPKSTNK